MNMHTNSQIVVWILIAMVSTALAQPQEKTSSPDLKKGIVALYNFDGRAVPNTIFKRLGSQISPFNGDDYLPRSAKGEIGPALQNPGCGSEVRAYNRSFY